LLAFAVGFDLAGAALGLPEALAGFAFGALGFFGAVFGVLVLGVLMSISLSMVCGAEAHRMRAVGGGK
jgi:hypothetical protein